MFSLAELRAVPLFSNLADEQIAYLLKTSADIRLLPGEYVLHEGETRRALFVLIEGRLEVTKFVDGAERVVGVRDPGESFGELPLALNTPFAVSVRATERARVMRVDAKDFQAVAASAPELSASVGAAALDRVGGLQDISASRVTNSRTARWNRQSGSAQRSSSPARPMSSISIRGRSPSMEATW